MSPDSPLEIALRLLRSGVDCLIVGGHAVNYHGYPRSTQDVDLLVRRTAQSDRAMYDVLSELNAFWISDDIDPGTGIERTIPVSLAYIAAQPLMMLGTDIGYVDLFTFIPGLPTVSLDDVFASAESVGELKFINLFWLRRMKAAAGRPQDLIDLAHLPG